MSNTVQITTKKGETVEAQAPVIISASRSTDIPAFYSEWFINRIKEGYVVWYNPFNQKPVYVSFKKCRVVVFWTKNPKPLIPYLKELDERGIHYYFQFTLNDYDKEKFEPNVPSLDKRIQTFKELSNLIGREKVIWRFDPMIVTKQLSPRDLLKRVWNIGNQIVGLTDKLVFSFVDINSYRKVQRNLVKESSHFFKETIEDSEFTEKQMNEIAEGLMKMREHWKQEGWPMSIATCAESIELGEYGIEHNRCIDGDLMKKVFSDDKDLVYYLNYGKLPDKNLLFQDEPKRAPLSPEKMKDKGQRKVCGCMVSKDIGMYNTCSHLCTYCYANNSKDLVMKNRNLHQVDSESIIK